MINFLKLCFWTKNGKHLRKHETVVCCNIGHWFGVTQKVGRHRKILILYQSESCLIRLLLVRRPYCEILCCWVRIVLSHNGALYFSVCSVLAHYNALYHWACTVLSHCMLCTAVACSVLTCCGDLPFLQIPATNTSIILIHCTMHFYYFVK